MDYRLLNYPEGAGKYRPEKDLPAAPFLSRPDAHSLTDEVVIVEGSKKAMVTTIRSGMNIDTVHTYGIPSKNSWAHIDRRVKDCGRVWIVPDPDGVAWGYKLAAAIGKDARVVELPFKPDDGFLHYGLDDRTWQNALRCARGAEGVKA